jgi:hypothetical protein
MTRGLAATAFWIAAAAVLMFEGFVWVRFGRWPGYSVIDAVSYLGPAALGRWARAPVTWPTLHKALSMVPLPAALALLAMALSWRTWRR